jgi:multiple sugar transport system ATP-binding protein
MARLVIEQLTKSYPESNGTEVRAVAGLDLTVEPGELLVLAGPSGCGKTTTLRMIAGLETPDSGRLLLDGREATHLAPAERGVALVFQNLALFPHLTVRENLGFGLKLRQVASAEAAARVHQVVEWLGLGGCLERLPETLSGGQRQRVALGRAMVQQPAIILLDEPLAQLDAPLRTQLRRELARWQRRSGAAMIYVTHDQQEAMALADRLAILRDGQLQQIAPPQVVYDRPANRFVGGFIGSPAMNFVEGVLRAGSEGLVFVEQGNGFVLPLPATVATPLAAFVGGSISLGLRPQALHVTESSGAVASFGAEIESVEPTGSETFLIVRTTGHSLVVRATGNPGASASGRVNVAADLQQAHFFEAGCGRAVTWRGG